MRAGVARIELDRTAELSLRPFPIPIVHEQRPGERRVRRRDRFIELERFARVHLGARVGFVNGNAAIIDVERVGVGQAGVGGRIVRILGDCLLEEAHGFGHTFLCSLVPGEPPFEIQTVGLDVFGVAPRDVLGEIGEHRRPQRVDDRAGDLVLNSEHVDQLAVVALRPELPPVVGRRELGGDAQPVARLAHRPLEHDA